MAPGYPPVEDVADKGESSGAAVGTSAGGGGRGGGRIWGLGGRSKGGGKGGGDSMDVAMSPRGDVGKAAVDVSLGRSNSLRPPSIASRFVNDDLTQVGGTVDLKGGTVDLKGGTVDPKGGTVDPKGGTVDPKGGSCSRLSPSLFTRSILLQVMLANTALETDVWSADRWRYKSVLTVAITASVIVAATNMDTVKVIVVQSLLSGCLLPVVSIALLLCLNEDK
jgi:hypothetical protein